MDTIQPILRRNFVNNLAFETLTEIY